MPPRPGQRRASTATTKLAARRLACGVTQQEMARVCGTSPATYWRLEHGQLPEVPLWLLNNCAIALGVELDDLIEDEWRAWHDPYGGQPKPPAPATFWRQRPG